MEEKLLEISKLLYNNHLTPEMANVLLLDLIKKNTCTLPTQEELNARIEEKLTFIKETWRMSEDFYEGLEKGYRGCIEWLEKR